MILKDTTDMERGKVELPSQVPECNWHWEGDREYLCSGSHSGTPDGRSALVTTKEIVPVKVLHSVFCGLSRAED